VNALCGYERIGSFAESSLAKVDLKDAKFVIWTMVLSETPSAYKV
jgi:hypothetical protein